MTIEKQTRLSPTDEHAVRVAIEQLVSRALEEARQPVSDEDIDAATIAQHTGQRRAKRVALTELAFVAGFVALLVLLLITHGS